MRRWGQRLFVAQIYAGSAAADAGFLRGDEILSIGPNGTELQAVADLIASDTLYTTLSSRVAGTARVFEVRTRAGSLVFRSAVTRQFSLDPVPEYRVLPRPGLTPIGYLNFRSFIGPAQARLEAAFQAFKAEQVTDVVVDLRYNGGGLLSVAEQLANLLSSNRDGHGDYFAGLPDATYAGRYCPAPDDPGNAQGDPSEASTYTALYWLTRNACPPTVGRPRTASEVLPVFPTPPRPGVAQIHQPGLF